MGRGGKPRYLRLSQLLAACCRSATTFDPPCPGRLSYHQPREYSWKARGLYRLLSYVVQFFGSQQAIFKNAKVAELADAPDLGSGTERCGGSSPPFRTME